jgi:hypothetical protein
MENLLVICDAHHTLIHERICSVAGTAPDELEFKGPFLSDFPRVMKEVRQRASGSGAGSGKSESGFDNDIPPVGGEPSGKEEDDEREHVLAEDWREKEVAAIFDEPPPEKPEPPDGDPLTTWANDYTKRLRRKRWVRKRRRGTRARSNGREHVFVERMRICSGLTT